MQYRIAPPDPRIFDILKAYSQGQVSAANAAFDIQARGIPGLEDPSASEVILWSKMAGFGIPDPGEEAAQAEAAALAARLRGGS